MNVIQPTISNWKTRNSTNAVKKKCRELDIYSEIFNDVTEPVQHIKVNINGAKLVKLHQRPKTRLDAIKECYGLDALQENKLIKLESGEVITAWCIEGYSTIDSFISELGEEYILETYDSGL